jgi:hypothetical protein
VGARGVLIGIAARGVRPVIAGVFAAFAPNAAGFGVAAGTVGNTTVSSRISRLATGDCCLGAVAAATASLDSRHVSS